MSSNRFKNYIMKHLLSAPSGGRTHTGRILSPLSLPLDYGGAQRLGSLLGVFGSDFQVVSA